MVSFCSQPDEKEGKVIHNEAERTMLWQLQRSEVLADGSYDKAAPLPVRQLEASASAKQARTLSHLASSVYVKRHGIYPCLNQVTKKLNHDNRAFVISGVKDNLQYVSKL